MDSKMIGFTGKPLSFLCLPSAHMHEHVHSNVWSTTELCVCCSRYAVVRLGRSPTRHRFWLVEVNSIRWKKLSVCMTQRTEKCQIVSSISSFNLRLQEECCIKIIHIRFFRRECWTPKRSKEIHPSSHPKISCISAKREY